METARIQGDINVAVNYIFYVSDYFDVSSRHAWKMDGKQAMLDQLQKNLPNCKVRKYTEYHGEKIEANSVGIVFPSHMWGISLAIYSFLQNIKVSEDTYVYAVAIGEVLSGEVDGTANLRVNTLGQFQEIFEKRKLGTQADIFIRCIDYKRTFATTEEKLLDSESLQERIGDVLEGLLFYSISDVMQNKLQCVSENEPFIQILADDLEKPEQKVVPMPKIRNLYLDDELLSEVRICQAI